MEDILEFEGYETLKMNLNYKEEIENNESDLKLLLKIKCLDKKFEEIEAYQGVLLSATKEIPYEIEVLIKGKFKFTAEMSENEKKLLCLVNIPAIQYPYLRAMVGIISSQIDYEKIILPTINFTEFFDKSNWDNILIKS